MLPIQSLIFLFSTTSARWTTRNILKLKNEYPNKSYEELLQWKIKQISLTNLLHKVNFEYNRRKIILNQTIFRLGNERNNYTFQNQNFEKEKEKKKQEFLDTENSTTWKKIYDIF